MRVLPDAEAASRAAAEEVMWIGRAAVAERGRFTVALSGGSTPRRMLEMLAEPPLRERLDWSRVDVFFADERAVPPDHSDSNFRLAHETLLSKLEIPEAQIHRMEAERSDLLHAAADYEAALRRVLRAPAGGPPPVLDLIHLGLGRDGHTASLFPGADKVLEERSLVAVTRAPDGGLRLTLTPTVLNHAAHVLFLVTEGEKAERLAEVLEGPRDVRRLPAQAVCPVRGTLLWIIDREAARDLRSPPPG